MLSLLRLFRNVQLTSTALFWCTSLPASHVALAPKQALSDKLAALGQWWCMQPHPPPPSHGLLLCFSQQKVLTTPCMGI